MGGAFWVLPARMWDQPLLAGAALCRVANFRNYKVWHAAHALTLELYRATDSFPKREWYALAGQIRRSGGSIPSNLAEGLGKAGEREKGRYLNIALGSAYELDCQLLLAHDLGYIDGERYKTLYRDQLEVRKMLHGLRRKINIATSS